MTQTNKNNQCSVCSGDGTYLDYVNWSDGLGGVDRICDLCNGEGTLAASPVALARKYKAEAAKARAELRQLRTHVALYLATSEGKVPHPPLRDAPGPSPHASTWREYLDRAIADLPRVRGVEFYTSPSGVSCHCKANRGWCPKHDEWPTRPGLRPYPHTN